MRTTILLLMLIVTSSTLAQTLDYFANEPVWREHWAFAQSSQCIQYSDKQIYIEGDSTLGNGLTYKKLMCTSYNWETSFGSPFCDDPSYYDNEFYALIRQSNDSIFQYQTWSNEEFLALHYNFNVGDTLQGAYYYWNSEPILVIGIDSIETLNGYHRRFSLYPELSSSPEYLVEGIGSYFGFLNGIGIMLNGTRELVCYRQNGIYQYGEDTVCSVVSSIRELSYLPLTVYPNPVSTSIVTIESDGIGRLKNPSLELYSLDGKQSKQIQTLNRIENQWRIKLNGVESGIYMVKIISEEGIGQSKLIVE